MSPVHSPSNAAATGDQPFPLRDNLANISRIQRMWRAQWPEFSWLTEAGNSASRCYQMFAPDISRVGYGAPDATHHNQCPVWSIMCPQQGIWIQPLGATLNIEVTVTGVGGWVTESPMSLEAQMTIKPKIWFSPSTVQNSPIIQALGEAFALLGIPFPSSKATAIELNAYGVNQQDQPVPSPNLTIQNGVDPNYLVPSFANHSSYDRYNQLAAHVVYVAVEIGEVIPTGHPIADRFNQLIMQLFNLASGNLLQYQNVLSWNVWALSPEAVYTPEWQLHAEYWRFSLDVNHRSPEGSGRNPQYFEGTPFVPAAEALVATLQELKNFLTSEATLANTSHVQAAALQLDRIVSAHQGRAAVFL